MLVGGVYVEDYLACLHVSFILGHRAHGVALFFTFCLSDYWLVWNETDSGFVGELTPGECAKGSFLGGESEENKWRIELIEVWAR